MAAQPRPRPIAPLHRLHHDHEWSGRNKTVVELMEERRLWTMSLPEGQSTQRMLGMHFGHMEDEWGRSQYCPVGQDFAAIKRSQSQGGLYRSCYANQEDNAEKVDPLGNLGGQSAHLLSHAKVCHRAYPFLAEAAIGASIQAMHLKGHVHTNRRKLLVGVKGGFHYTSLKGHKLNKMYWKLQGEHFDSDDPSVLVVPLLPLNQILDWATDHVHAGPYDVAVFTFGPRRQVVAAETLQFAKGICTRDEKTLARENLTAFVKGIASHLVTEDVFESLPEKYFTPQNPSLLRWRELVNQMRINPQIFIPTACDEDEADPSNIRTAKARMTTGTSLPDPWLLLAKSAINYTASNGQQVMPACPLPEESDSEDSDDEHRTTTTESIGDMKDEQMDVIRAGFYSDALQRSGFSCVE